jgi:hypothetical protein
MQDQKMHRSTQRIFVFEDWNASVHLVEHAGAYLGVSEEVHLAVWRNRARANLADVVQQRGPADFDSRHGLAHDLLRVLPNVFVAPLAVAEADHGRYLRQQRAEGTGLEQSIETAFGVVAHQYAIEVRAHVARVSGSGGLRVGGARERSQRRGLSSARMAAHSNASIALGVAWELMTGKYIESSTGGAR